MGKRKLYNYFISSTFSDMQEERDAINTRIIPILKSEFLPKGELVAVTDLRWGIVTQEGMEEAKSKLMAVCLRDIDNCKPCIVVLLGDRYGSVPDRNSIKALMESEYGSSFECEKPEECSYTELEIIHAIKSFKRMQEEPKVIICLRDKLPEAEILEENKRKYISDGDDKERLERLKERLKSEFPNDCISYHVEWDKNEQRIVSVKDFEDKLIDRIRSQIQMSCLGRPLTKWEGQEQFENVLFHNIENNEPREKELEEIVDFMNSDSASMLISGKSGAGKSTLLRLFYHRYCNDYNIHYLPLGFGELSSIRNTFEYLLWKNNKPTDFEKIEDCVKTINSFLSTNDSKKTLIIFDGVDMLKSDSNLRYISEIGTKGFKVKTIISLAEEEKGLLREFAENCETKVTLSLFDEEQENRILKFHLDRIGRKELSKKTEEVVKRIIAYKTPLFISMLCDRINMINRSDFDVISKHRGNGLRTEENLYNHILEMADKISNEKDLVESIVESLSDEKGLKIFWKIVALVCEFNKGIRVPEICDILSISENNTDLLDVKCYIYYLDGIFKINNTDSVSFKHNKILKVCKQLIGRQVDTESLTEDIYSFLNNLDDRDETKIRSFTKYAFIEKDLRSVHNYINRLVKNDREDDLRKLVNSFPELYFSFDTNEVTGFLCNLINCTDPDTTKGFADIFLYITKDFNSVIPPQDSTSLAYALFDLVKKYCNYYKGDLEYKRLLYMCAEVACMNAGSLGDRRDLAQGFYDSVIDLLSIFDDSDKYGYIIDDFGKASISLAESIGDPSRWEEAIEIVNFAIAFLEDNINSEYNLPIPMEVTLYDLYRCKLHIVLDRVYNLYSVGWTDRITNQMWDIMLSTAFKLRESEFVFESLKEFPGKSRCLAQYFFSIFGYSELSKQPWPECLEKAKKYAEISLDANESSNNSFLKAVILRYEVETEYQKASEEWKEGNIGYAAKHVVAYLSKMYPDYTQIRAIFIEKAMDRWIGLARDVYEQLSFNDKEGISITRIFRLFYPAFHEQYRKTMKMVYDTDPCIDYRIEYYYALDCEACITGMHKLDYEKLIFRGKRNSRHKTKGYLRSRLIGCIKAAKFLLCEFKVIPNIQDAFLNYVIDMNRYLPGRGSECLSLLKADRDLWEKDFLEVGRWFYDNIDKPLVRMAILRSNLFELAALKYAYYVIDYSTAEDIIRNGYDRYLELSMLYLIRKNDRRTFYKYWRELKPECVTKNIEIARKNKDLLGDFYGELN